MSFLCPNEEVILVISDTQAPFHHPDTIEFLVSLKNKYRPTKVIHIGDLLDLHNFSTYLKSPESPSVKEEITGAIGFIKELGYHFPEMIIVESNHDSRIARQAALMGIRENMLKPLSEIFEFPKGWIMQDNYKIDNIRFEHGMKVSGKYAHIRLMEAYGCSVVTGHHHTNYGISYHKSPECENFAMAVGCLIDVSQPAFDYTRKHLRQPILGTGVVEYGVPILHPMFTDYKNRWVGRQSNFR